MSKLIVRRDVEAIAPALIELHPVLQRVYTSRKVSSADALNRDLEGLPSFSAMLNIDAAAQRLMSAIKDQQRILVVGDFDADGATSTALAVSALRAFGAENVDFIVPNRFAFGYGLTPEIVDAAMHKQPQLIITVDNGISSLAGVARARELGVDVVITDHHLPGDHMPTECIIVNPNQPNDLFPSKSLAGVGVIFYVMLGLRALLKNENWFAQREIECPNMSQFLDLVALGTIADVVPLDRVNRILVHQGIRRIRARYARAGILALLQVAGRPASRITASDLGFVVGPRLNAAGRLEDMSLGIECLLAEDPERAHYMAIELDRLNRERRAIEVQMQHEAFAIVEKLDLSGNMPMALCLYDEAWHQGVVGLVAARVKERVHRPVIAFAKGSDGSLKGSARSVPGIHIRDMMDAVAKNNPGLITKFGGHAMAAGMSLEVERFEEFSQAFAKEVAKYLREEQCHGLIHTDGELSRDDLTFELAELLRESGPWGQEFPEPMFDGIFNIIDQRLVGKRHLRMLLQLPNTSHTIDAMAFNVDVEQWPNYYCAQIHAVYRLDINEYRGLQKLQLLVEELWQVPAE